MIAPAVLHTCLSSAEETTFADYSARLLQSGDYVEAFQEPPIPGNALYFAFEGDVSGYSFSLTVDCEVEGVGVDPRDPPLAWDAWAGETKGWIPVEVLSDGTGGLNVSGEVLFVMPGALRERAIAGKSGVGCASVSSSRGRGSRCILPVRGWHEWWCVRLAAPQMRRIPA